MSFSPSDGMKAGLENSAGGLYIHIAYCRRKCLYCDFFSAGERIADWKRYTDALLAEFESRINELPCPLQTVYVGGGTPSLMPGEEFIRLAEALRPYTKDVVEFTLEVNPDDVSEEKLKIWKRGGVNRLSMGVQTFHDNLLKTIGRLHDATTAHRAYSMARSHFRNISIDLIFGLPGQTLEMWKKDVDVAIELAPEHISSYSLMYEPGTAMTALRNQGRLEEAEENISEEMYAYLAAKLHDAAYLHYEISNYAKPGFTSRHNSSYWKQMPYLGLGPSAHSYDGRRLRRANTLDLKGYIAKWKEGKLNESLYTEEHLLEEELKDEYIMTRLRTSEGIQLADFECRFGNEAAYRLLQRCRMLEKEGYIHISDGRIAINEHWWLTSDSIILDLAMQ